MTEERDTPIQKRILEALKAIGIVCWRANAGTARGGRTALSPPGTPDILAVIPPRGRLCGIEVKRPSAKGKRRESQVLWHTTHEALGVRVATVSSPAEAVRCLLDWQDAEHRQ